MPPSEFRKLFEDTVIARGAPLLLISAVRLLPVNLPPLLLVLSYLKIPPVAVMIALPG